jgi:uncharacterized protein YuzE
VTIRLGLLEFDDVVYDEEGRVVGITLVKARSS